MEFRKDSVDGNSAAQDVGVAQMLALAELANVSFHVVNGKLLMRCARMDRRFWPPVRQCLDELGVETIVRYLQCNSPAEQAVLSAAA